MAQYSKEVVLESLKRIPSEMIWVKKYFIAVIEDDLLEHYYERFVFEKNNYSDELPELRVGSIGTSSAWTTQLTHKCQGNYISQLRMSLVGLIKDDMIDDSILVKEILDFNRYKFKYKDSEFTTPEEIDMINHILDDVISYLCDKCIEEYFEKRN